ncbi:MAG: CPBP family intramembrane metalloprotease, partial [Gammaproteobacteria bacterium]|nr:CPBP family intramembrane metalloprotease [Gammaproteobacteria bacterium]
PAIEEVVNRGYILPALIRNRCKLPVLTSACLFAVLHRPDSMLVALMFGIVVAVQLMHCRSLWGPAIAHATFNLLFVMDGHCLRYPKLEAALLSLPPLTLAVLGAAIGVAAFLLAVRIARWTGAATR